MFAITEEYGYDVVETRESGAMGRGDNVDIFGILVVGSWSPE